MIYRNLPSNYILQSHKNMHVHSCVFWEGGGGSKYDEVDSTLKIIPAVVTH